MIEFCLRIKAEAIEAQPRAVFVSLLECRELPPPGRKAGGGGERKREEEGREREKRGEGEERRRGEVRKVGGWEWMWRGGGDAGGM